MADARIQDRIGSPRHKPEQTDGVGKAMRTYTRTLLSALAIIAASLSFVGSASATVVKMDTLYAGETPSAPAGGPGTPWLTATLTYNGPGSTTGLFKYTLTFQSYLTNNEFVGGVNRNIGWAFSLTDTPSNVTYVSGTQAIRTRTSSILTGPVPGPFNLAFYWGANNFTTGSTSTYSIESTTSSASAFFAVTGLESGMSNLYSAAHIQGITGANQTCSVWIVNDGTSGFTPNLKPCGDPRINVPEPSELPLMALGLSLILVAWYAARRRQHR